MTNFMNALEQVIETDWFSLFIIVIDIIGLTILFSPISAIFFIVNLVLGLFVVVSDFLFYYKIEKITNGV